MLVARMTAVFARVILLAVGLLSSILMVDAKLGEEHIGLTELNGARYVYRITPAFEYDIWTSATRDTPPMHTNVFPGLGPFEEIAPYTGFGAACARRPNGISCMYKPSSLIIVDGSIIVKRFRIVMPACTCFCRFFSHMFFFVHVRLHRDRYSLIRFRIRV